MMQPTVIWRTPKNKVQRLRFSFKRSRSVATKFSLLSGKNPTLAIQPVSDNDCFRRTIIEVVGYFRAGLRDQFEASHREVCLSTYLCCLLAGLELSGADLQVVLKAGEFTM